MADAASILKPIPAHESALLEAGECGGYRSSDGWGQPRAQASARASVLAGRSRRGTLRAARRYWLKRRPVEIKSEA
jgi:hypothetical protein